MLRLIFVPIKQLEILLSKNMNSLRLSMIELLKKAFRMKQPNKNGKMIYRLD
jgi:hypothetical protein